MRAPLRSLALAAGIALGLIGQAQAHAHLRSAVPPADTAVAHAPTELDLRFSEALELRFTGLTLTDPDGQAVAIGPARLAAGDDSLLIVPITGGLAPGSYRVDWHALSADGHKTQGAYTFSIAP